MRACQLTETNVPQKVTLINCNAFFQANSSCSDIENLLANSAPFSRGKQAEEETEWEANKRKQIRSFFVTGKKVASSLFILPFSI